MAASLAWVQTRLPWISGAFCWKFAGSPVCPRVFPAVQFKFMRPRSRLRNALEYGAAIVVLASLQWAPRKLAFALARAYTRLLDLGIPRLRRGGGPDPALVC